MGNTTENVMGDCERIIGAGQRRHDRRDRHDQGVQLFGRGGGVRTS